MISCAQVLAVWKKNHGLKWFDAMTSIECRWIWSFVDILFSLHSIGIAEKITEQIYFEYIIYWDPQIFVTG